MRFQISLERQTILLKDRQRVPDGVINLSGTVDHLVRQVGCLKLQRFSHRSAMPLIITRLVEDSMFASEVQPLSIGGEQQMRYDLEVRLAGAILQARLLQLANGDDGFDCPQDAVNAAFSPEYLEALREQLRIVAYHLSDPKKSEFVADIDLSSCSVISGALATNTFAEDDDVERFFFDEKTVHKINFRDILNNIKKDEDENQYDDEDWRAWWDNNEPPFGKDK
jgi:hypothetical protein